MCSRDDILDGNQSFLRLGFDSRLFPIDSSLLLADLSSLLVRRGSRASLVQLVRLVHDDPRLVDRSPSGHRRPVLLHRYPPDTGRLRPSTSAGHQTARPGQGKVQTEGRTSSLVAPAWRYHPCRYAAAYGRAVRVRVRPPERVRISDYVRVDDGTQPGWIFGDVKFEFFDWRRPFNVYSSSHLTAANVVWNIIWK